MPIFQAKAKPQNILTIHTMNKLTILTTLFCFLFLFPFQYVIAQKGDVSFIHKYEVTNEQCHDNGTINNPLDDFWTFDFKVSLVGTTAPDAMWMIPGVASGHYGVTTQLGPFPMSDGSQEFHLKQIGNPNVSLVFVVHPPAPCSSGNGHCSDLFVYNLEIYDSPVHAGQVLTYSFDLENMGMGDIIGDFVTKAYISRNINIGDDDIQEGIIDCPGLASEAIKTGLIGASTIPDDLLPGTYYLILHADGDSEIMENNERNNCVAVPFEVINDAVSGDIDLAIAMEMDMPTPSVFTIVSMRLTIINTGVSTATNIKVHFPKPDGVVYVGGSEWAATQGVFYPYGIHNGEWEINSLTSGEWAYLDLNYFILQSGNFTPYAQVTAADQTDYDSTPDNGNCCVANEDDEAVLSFNAFSDQDNEIALRGENTNTESFSIYPNPASNKVNIQYDLQADMPVVYQIFDTNGQVVYETKKKDQTIGMHTHSFSRRALKDLVDGVYFCRIVMGDKHETQGFVLMRE